MVSRVSHERCPTPPRLWSLSVSFRSICSPHVVLTGAIGFAVAACDVNPYDASQQPRVSVAASATPVISWQPEGAQLVRVYRGTTAGDGYTAALVWSIAATSSNSLRSGVSYGASAPTGGTIDVAANPISARSDVYRAGYASRSARAVATALQIPRIATWARPPSPRPRRHRRQRCVYRRFNWRALSLVDGGVVGSDAALGARGGSRRLGPPPPPSPLDHVCAAPC